LGINTMNFYDRQVLPSVQEKIRQEWKLSDSDLGWLGTAFMLLYALVGLPLGHLADVWRRRWILAAGVGLWSLLTLASGWAWGFWSLFVLRLGVGVGEASCAPAANSLIGDLVPTERRARTLAFFMLGLPLGLALSPIISGAIAERRSWQEAFYVAGFPGFLLAVAALFILDPKRGTIEDRVLKIEDGGSNSTSSLAPSRKGAKILGAFAALRETLDPRSSILHPRFVMAVRRVLSKPTMAWIIASGAIHNFNMYALGTFLASFLKRYHHVGVERAGQVSGLVYGFGALGILGAGWLADRAFRGGAPKGRLHVAWIGVAGAVPFLLLALIAPAGQLWLCAIWLLPAYLLLYTYYGTVYATIQDITEPSLRGTAMAIYFCAMYFLGAVFGPVATGWLSDYCARQAARAAGSLEVTELHKAIGLHDAMYLIPILSVALVAVLFAATRTVEGDYRRLQERPGLSEARVDQ
jgi:MFS family permease